MPEEEKKQEYVIIANCWNKETRDGREYISISWKEEMTLMPDTPLWMFKNTRNRRPGKNDSHWTISIKIEDYEAAMNIVDDAGKPSEAKDQSGAKELF